jgi:hypothetical protein
LESAEPAKSAKSAESAESAAGADYESGQFMVQGLTEKTVGPDKGAAAAMPTGGKIGNIDLCSCRFVGENRQRRFFDEHGLDDGLSRPCRKIHRGYTLKKQRWFRHGGRSVGIDSADEIGKAGRTGTWARARDPAAHAAMLG